MSMNDYPLLWEARYDAPASEVIRPDRTGGAKTLVVICTYIPEDLRFTYVSKSHYSETGGQYIHNRLECLKFVLACYQHFDAGASYDLIIVDNDSPRDVANQYFKTLDIPVIQRENTYFSFGAYKAAWEHFGNDYDYFVFHEMDWNPCRHNWLRMLIDMWESDSEIGMMGNLIEFRTLTKSPQNREERVSNEFINYINPNRSLQYNLDSEYLFVDKVVLKQMDDIGWLLFGCHPKVNLSPAYNELAFQQPILEMGYKLRCFNDGKNTMFYATYNQDLPEQWNNGLENLTPFIPEQVRLFIPEFCDYFDFYDHAKHSSLVKEFL